jgi:glutathionylspermidine amidase/synthetase
MPATRIALFHNLLSFILLALPLNTAHADNAESEIPIACRTDCISPYGRVLGVSTGGVEAYSNCQSRCVIFEPNKWKGTYTGIKWQCVEYARRWLLVHKGAVYGDVDIAADIWDKIDHLTHVATNTRIPLEPHLNGSNQPPQIGDLLVYARAFYDTGHVAVVTDVDYENSVIEVGEQNYNNEPWPEDYARTIEFIKKDNNYWLLDGYLIGWKHVKNQDASGRSKFNVP